MGWEGGGLLFRKSNLCDLKDWLFDFFLFCFLRACSSCLFGGTKGYFHEISG